MKLRAILPVAVLGLTAAVFAQNAPAPSKEPPAAPPAAQRPGPKNRGDAAAAGPGMMLDRMSERIAQTLNLTPAQMEQLQKITDEFRPRFQSADFRELARKLAEARTSGDQKQIDAAEAALEQARAGQEKLIVEYMDRVEPILNPQQAQDLTELRSRFSGESRRGAHLDRLIESLPEDLQLTAEQRTKFAKLAATWRAARDSQREQVRSLTEQLREAQKAGNEERVGQIRKQLDQARAATDPSETFYAEFEKILTDEQKAKLSELRASTAEGGRRDRGPAQRVRAVLRAAERLELSKEQRDSVRDIARKAMREARDAKPGEGSGAETELAQRVKKEITALLTPEQVTQFEEALKDQKSEKPRERPAGHKPDKRGAESKPAKP
jgi:Spy/CpxP family protein refolding chaperone